VESPNKNPGMQVPLLFPPNRYHILPVDYLKSFAILRNKPAVTLREFIGVKVVLNYQFIISTPKKNKKPAVISTASL
jgi:hypothetical protein